MSSGRHHRRDALLAPLWRRFVFAIYVGGTLEWLISDASRRPALRMSTCLYGRCPTSAPAGPVGVHPTIGTVALLGVAAALIAWAMPLFIGTHENQRGDHP